MQIQAAIKRGSFSENEAMSIFAQIVLAMTYLHQNNIIHRDLKPENILLDEGGRVIICDFGFSKQLSTFSAVAKSLAGSYPYMPPEMLIDQDYGSNADVWAAGVILIELLTGDD